MSAVLGINCFSHDTSACLVVDGVAVAMGEEERFNRDRHTKAFPDSAIRFCLDEAGLEMRDLDAVAMAHQPATDFRRGATDALARLAPKRLAAQAFVDGRLVARERAFRRRWSYANKPLYHVGHHEAHAASAFFASPFDKAAVLTLDRGGDFLSTTLAVGEGSRLRTLAEVANPHSLGEVYSALTWYLGFEPNGDEGKVMGLASYGSERMAPDLSHLLRLRPDGRFKVNLSWFGYQREAKVPLSKRFLERYGPPRVPESEIAEGHEGLAFAVQKLTEEAGLHVARALREASGAANLCLAGGVALNCVMNGRLLRDAGFENVFVQPAASDAGNALGAALWVFHHLRGGERAWSMDHPYLGRHLSDTEAEAAMARNGRPFRKVGDPAGVAAELLDAGKVVGWFQGRAEVGPRALGARSILADPRRAEMRDVVNSRVKRREWFRPFAPSVAHEAGAEYFSGYVDSPFMALAFDVVPAKRAVIPAVTHVDGTARVQSVKQSRNPLYARLIERFAALSGVPVVLNTSYNLRGEPIVHTPAQALADFERSEMDAAIIGPYVVEKEEPPA